MLAAAPAAQASPQRVLFVGNSLTAANDLPATVSALAGAAGRPVEVDVRAPGFYSYRAAARENGALLLPAGLAWKNVLRAHRSIKLYGPDGFHPSRLGTYLAAVTIAAGITGQPAVGMARLGVPARVAAILQRAAAAALRAR